MKGNVKIGHLILNRYQGEKIDIGDNITIEILGIEQRKVKIGIFAPNNISVHRREITKRIKENEQH